MVEPRTATYEISTEAAQDTTQAMHRRRFAIRLLLIAAGGLTFDRNVVGGTIDAPVRIELPARPLGEALRELAKQADLQILFDAAVVADFDGRRVSGTLTARSALRELLAGTGLEATEQTPGVVVIRKSSRDSTPVDAGVP